MESLTSRQNVENLTEIAKPTLNFDIEKSTFIQSASREVTLKYNYPEEMPKYLPL